MTNWPSDGIGYAPVEINVLLIDPRPTGHRPRHQNPDPARAHRDGRGGEIPTIIHEQLALCLTDTGGSGTATSRDVYRVIATRWLGPRPGDHH